MTLEWRGGRWVCEVRCPACGSSSAASNAEPGEARRRAVRAWDGIGRPEPTALGVAATLCLCMAAGALGGVLGPVWGGLAALALFTACAALALARGGR